MFLSFPGMGLFDSFNSNLNPFIEKMEKGELTVEDILNEETIIQDIKSNNDSKFLTFLTNDKIKKLIDYSTRYPSIDEHNIGYKYPFNATEILCSDNTNFQNIFMSEKALSPVGEINDKETIKRIEKGGFIMQLFKAINNKNKNIEDNENDSEDESGDSEVDEEEKKEGTEKKVEIGQKILYENVDYLLSFLNESDRTKENYVLVGYFYKILNNLINIHQMKIVKYLLDYPKKDEFDIIKLFIKHMNRRSMGNIIQKLLAFDEEMVSQIEEKKTDLLSQIFSELEMTEEKNKYDCISECIYNVINNKKFFDLFMAKTELLNQIYNIIFNCKNNDKYSSIIKLLTKINYNILQHFPVHYTDNVDDINPNNDLMPLNLETYNSNDKSLSSPEDNVDTLKKFLLSLFELLEKSKFDFFNDFKYNDDCQENNEFIPTYMEKQKKLGMKKLLQTEYLKSLIDVMINSSASGYYEDKVETLVNYLKEKNIFWNLHNIFLNFPFNNIFQIYYHQIMKFFVNENTPKFLIDALFSDDKNNNIIELYINKILSDMKFTFKLTKTEAFNPLFSYIITILSKISTSQNMHTKKNLENNKDISVFYEVMGEEIEKIFKQKLLLNDNNMGGGLYFDNVEETPLETFGPQNFMEIFEENCKIYEIYKNGGDYKKALNEKKERMEKAKEKDKKEKKSEKKGLEYIDDPEEDDDPLFKVEKINLHKEKENFLALLNKPTEEVNNEEDNKDVILDNIENDGDFKEGQLGRFKELWDEDEDKEEKKEENNNEKNDDNKEENNKNVIDSENKEDKNEKSNDEKQ